MCLDPGGDRHRPGHPALTERLRRVVQSADNLQGDWRNLLLQMDWRLFADHLVAQLEKEKDDNIWLFLVDEITIFTKALLDSQGVTAASDFLYKLRQLCREHRKVRWLFTGSIGLDTIARRHGFEGSLVDLEIFSLEPFSPETARGFLQQIAGKNDATLTEEAVSALCERLGWLSPHYLKKIGEGACEFASPAKEVDAKAAHLAADSLLDPPNGCQAKGEVLQSYTASGATGSRHWTRMSAQGVPP